MGALVDYSGYLDIGVVHLLAIAFIKSIKFNIL